MRKESFDMVNENNSKVKEIAENVSESAKNLMNKAVGVTKVSKATTVAIHKDIDELLDWIEKRNDAIQNESGDLNDATFEELPTLGKVIVGGEDGIKQLPESKQKIYTEYFKKNAARIAVLTAINPLLGIGALGADAASSGIVSTKDGIATSAIGAGLVGASTAATALSPISYAAWTALKTFVPAARLAGVGLLAFAAGATLFKTVENSPIGKRIIEIGNETEQIHNGLQEKLEKNLSEIGETLSAKIKCAVEKLETTSKKIAITIDDAVHSDQNLRLMQYNQIITDLFNSQNEIRVTLAELTEKYNALQVENEKLAKYIVECRENLQKLACCSEFEK